MVSGLPPQSGEGAAPARIHHHHGLSAGRRPGRDRATAEKGIRREGCPHADQLRHLPPMSDLPIFQPGQSTPEPPRKKLELSAAREQLASARGRDYWRSLEDLSGTPEFQ